MSSGSGAASGRCSGEAPDTCRGGVALRPEYKQTSGALRNPPTRVGWTSCAELDWERGQLQYNRHSGSIYFTSRASCVGCVIFLYWLCQPQSKWFLCLPSVQVLGCNFTMSMWHDCFVAQTPHAQYLQRAWKRDQDAVYWVDINFAFKKGKTVYQTRSNAVILQETLPAYCIPQVVRMETGEVLYEKVYMSPRPPPKISLKHEWKRELGSEHAQRSEVGQLSRSFQSNQPILNPIRERTGRPVISGDLSTVQNERKTSRSQKIDVNSFHEEPVSSERTERAVIETSVIQARSSEDRKDSNVEKAHERTRRLVSVTNTENVPDSSQTRSVHESETFNVGDKTLRERTVRPVIDHDDFSREQTMLNEVNMDFRIPRLPHSVVKHAQSTSVRELIQKIENHPDRHALQQDLRQNQAYNPFSSQSKKMIQDVGNIELCELLETEPKTQCTACLSCWNIGIVYCTCGHFLQIETAVNRKFVKYTMDLLSVPEDVIKEGRAHGHKYGTKPGDEEYYLANQLKKKCKKRQFQGIHDRFLRDHEFRIRMIEHH